MRVMAACPLHLMHAVLFGDVDDGEGGFFTVVFFLDADECFLDFFLDGFVFFFLRTLLPDLLPLMLVLVSWEDPGFVVVLPKECFELVRLPGTDLIVDVVILPQECFEFVRLP
eukprot:s3446_g12.t1